MRRRSTRSKILARATSSTRTATQTYIAKWWQSNPVASWNDVARQLIARNDLDAADSARLLAMENLVAADAAINTWNDKYHFSFWRPFQAIRRAADDGNSATSPDADVDAAAHGAVPRTRVGTPRARQLAHRRAADVLRQRTRRGLPDHERLRESRRRLLRVRSPASRRRSTRSSRPASGRGSISAPRTCRPYSSERTWRTTRPRTTSSQWATTDPQGAARAARSRRPAAAGLLDISAGSRDAPPASWAPRGPAQVSRENPGSGAPCHEIGAGRGW